MIRYQAAQTLECVFGVTRGTCVVSRPPPPTATGEHSQVASRLPPEGRWSRHSCKGLTANSIFLKPVSETKSESQRGFLNGKL